MIIGSSFFMRIERGRIKKSGTQQGWIISGEHYFWQMFVLSFSLNFFCMFSFCSWLWFLCHRVHVLKEYVMYCQNVLDSFCICFCLWLRGREREGERFFKLFYLLKIVPFLTNEKKIQQLLLVFVCMYREILKINCFIFYLRIINFELFVCAVDVFSKVLVAHLKWEYYAINLNCGRNSQKNIPHELHF